MTPSDYKRISEMITAEQDAVRDKMVVSRDTEAIATYLGKIDGLGIAREIVRAVAFTGDKGGQGNG